MSTCICVSVSPDFPNIFYEVKRRNDLESDFGDLVCSLQAKLVDTPRVIVYCQSLNTCSDLFAHFLFHLGPASYYPPGSAEVSDNRLFGMYHSCTSQYNKDIILESLRDPNGVVWIVFATVALGIGIFRMWTPLFTMVPLVVWMITSKRVGEEDEVAVMLVLLCIGSHVIVPSKPNHALHVIRNSSMSGNI